MSYNLIQFWKFIQNGAGYPASQWAMKDAGKSSHWAHFWYAGPTQPVFCDQVWGAPKRAMLAYIDIP